MSTLTLFINSLTTIDCAYFDKQRGLVGESWIVDVQMSGAQDEQGMLMDFADVKRVIKAYIDEAVDHRLLIPIQSEAVDIEQAGRRVNLTLSSGGVIEYQAPLQATAFIESKVITTDSVIQHLKRGLSTLLTSNITDYQISLRAEQIAGAYYHYSHGLKMHEGNCQRIVHGHRSKIVVYQKGARDTQLEETIAQMLADIYIVTEEDIQSTYYYQGQSYYHVAYTALQGDFSLKLPVTLCYVMQDQSTVENIALVLANQFATQTDDNTITITAYEGVSKGAIALSPVMSKEAIL